MNPGCLTTVDNPGKNLHVKVAAKILGMSELSVRGALIAKALPIGSAWKNPGSSCWKYYISPRLLSEYSGVSIEDINAIAEDI